jgi:hypothetical protein
MSTDRSSEHQPAKRKVPILVWIVVAIFVAWAVIAFMQNRGETSSTGEVTHPTAAQGDVVMPAAPATPSAPGTPASQTP